MRRAMSLLLALCSLPLFAQEIEFDLRAGPATRNGVVPVEEVDVADVDAWREALARAQREKKPIVVLYRSSACSRCGAFERETLAHPMIARRLPAVVFATLSSSDPGIAFFDRSGVLRVRWPIVPDTTDFGVILDSVLAVAPHFERALELSDAGQPHHAELELANGFARIGRVTAAREALERARTHGDADVQQKANAALTVLDARQNPPPPVQPRAMTGAIRILPLGRQVVSSRHAVKTHVVSSAVAQVRFSLDGREVARVDRPPFSATLDFGDVPERRAIRVVAFDGKGTEIGRDERVVNEAGETFWLRLVDPREGSAGGAVRVTLNIRVPATHRVQRAVISWNDAERSVLTAAPWEATIDIPPNQTGVLRAIAELDDGRSAEDAVLLNAMGAVDQASVQLVELPITLMSGDGAIPEITPDRITVREGKRVRRVESIANAAETPLTIGLLIDVSDSMQKSLPDVQEAAIRFLETMLGERDRAFLVAFDTRARLVQSATSDKALLRRKITSIRLDGLTAVHDAMVLGLLQFEGIKGRRAMIVFSDGLDLTSRYDAADVGELARRVNVPIHVIASVPLGSTAPADEQLKRIAPATGGTSHALENLAELPSVYSRIESALRAQILAFVRTDPATRDNEWRPIDVEVAGPDLRVFAPEGYYATW